MTTRMIGAATLRRAGLVAMCACVCALTPNAVATEREVERLLATVPDNAGAMVLIDRPGRLVASGWLEPVLSTLAKPAAEQWMRCARKTPGALVVGVIPNRDPERGFDVFAAMALDALEAEDALHNWLEQALLPAIRNALGLAEADMRLSVASGGGRIVDRRDETLINFAVKDKVAFACTSAAAVSGWRRGEWPEKPWTGMPGVRRLLKGLDKQSDIRVFANPAAWARHWPKAKRNTTEELAQTILALEDFQAAALDVGLERRAVELRLSIALAESCKGVASILCQPATSSRALGQFPSDYSVFARLAWPSLAAVTQGSYGLTDLFDPSISEEYREELAELDRKAGFSWEQGLLGNLVKEVVIGARIDLTRSPPIAWAAMAPLADEAAFSSHLDRLIEHFELPFDLIERDSLRIRVARETVPFAIAVTGGKFIVADGDETIVELCRSPAKEGALPADRRLASVYESLGAENNAAVLVNVERIAKGVPMLRMMAGPAFGPLLADGAIGATLRTRDRVAVLRVRWETGRDRADAGDSKAAENGEASGAAPGPLLADALFNGMLEMRRESQRTVAMSRMRGITQTLHVYAQRHDGQFPESLAELLRDMPDAIPLELFASPYDGDGPASADQIDAAAFVVYRPGLTASSDPREIVLAERRPQQDGASFAFVDGHIEFIANPRASELLALIESGAAEVRP